MTSFTLGVDSRQTTSLLEQILFRTGIALKASGPQLQALKVSCIGRTNDVPNIQENYAWIGNSSGVATPTELNLSVLGDVNDSLSPSNGEVLIWNNTLGYFVSNTLTAAGDGGNH